MNAASRNVDDVVPAWRELEARAPVKLCSIHTERHHKAMREFMNKLLDEIGDQESHPLMGNWKRHEPRVGAPASRERLGTKDAATRRW